MLGLVMLSLSQVRTSLLIVNEFLLTYVSLSGNEVDRQERIGPQWLERVLDYDRLRPLSSGTERSAGGQQ